MSIKHPEAYAAFLKSQGKHGCYVMVEAGWI